MTTIAKITNALERNHGTDVLNLLTRLDEAAMQERLAAYAAQWDDGRHFAAEAYMDLFAPDAKRASDSQEEIDACAKRLYDDLCELALDRWVKAVTREQAVTLLNVLDKDAQLVVAGAIRLSERILMTTWNDAHADEQPIAYRGGWDA